MLLRYGNNVLIILYMKN